jgi:ribosomal protein L37E
MLWLHDYHTTKNDSGEAYEICSRCGKESFPVATNVGPYGMPLG